MDKISNDIPVQQRLDELEGRLEAWRISEENKGRYIPKEVWQEATALAKVLGTGVVARRLRLYSPKLKALVENRREAPKKGTRRSPKSPVAFVEVPIGRVPDSETSKSGFEFKLRWGLRQLNLEWR